MTLIITALAALIVTAIRFIKPEFATNMHMGFLALMYFGASLMWSIDGFFALSEGEPFVELADSAAMADDALLGICVVVLGLVVWGITLFIKRSRAPKTSSAA